MKTIGSTIFFICITSLVVAQGGKIEVPGFDDKYSKYVKQLEEGNLDIDYAEFRNSFLDSRQYESKGDRYDSLKAQVYIEARNKNFQEVVRLTKAMLSIDYTSMFAHKYLQQTYKLLGDSLNQQKYHDIEFGLLYSIMRSGDGKTCETGWCVTQIEEEYFILAMIGARLNRQSITRGGKNYCDQMDVVTTEGETKTYFFEANKVFERERKSLEGR